MSDRGTNEAVQVELGLAEIDESPWEWGVYFERNDGRSGQDDWTPIVYGYGELSYEDAYEQWQHDSIMVTRMPDRFRNPRLVRRAVGPWGGAGP